MPREYDVDEYVMLLDKNPCKFSKVVGFCHNNLHRGYISKSLLKSHECIEKECTLLERFDHRYWAQIERERNAKQERRRTRTEKTTRFLWLSPRRTIPVLPFALWLKTAGLERLGLPLLPL